MNCFSHSGSPALAACKHCGKGLCLECSVDTGYGMSCRGSCEEEVRFIRDIIRKNPSVYAKTSEIYLRAVILYSALALVFLGVIFYFRETMPREVKFLLGGGGAVFLMGALFNLVNARKMKKLA